MKEAVKIKANLMWANLNRLNMKSKKYQVDLCNLSDKAVAALEEQIGVKARTRSDKPEMGRFITCKSTKPIFAYDDGGSQIDGDIVGNGSEAVVVVSYYEYPNPSGPGKARSGSVQRLVVTKLNEYRPGSAMPTEEFVEDAL